MTASHREGKAYGFFWYGGPVEDAVREVSSIEGMDHLPANLTLKASTLDTFLERAELDAGLRNFGELARRTNLNVVVEATRPGVGNHSASNDLGDVLSVVHHALYAGNDPFYAEIVYKRGEQYVRAKS